MASSGALNAQRTDQNFCWSQLQFTNFRFITEQQVETHNKEGKRERYFADDDRYDLKEMVRREKMQTAEDNNAMMARLSSKVN